MNAQLSKTNLSVSAYCPTCQAVTSFDPKFTTAPVPGVYPYQGQTYTRAVNIFGQCPRCSRGGLAVVLDTGNPPADAVLESFYPVSIDAAPLPSAVPSDIEKEFREAERCAAFGANRAASALFRSALEKTLKANGYTKTIDRSLVDLRKRIDAAAADGIITAARQKKAHDDIRSLANDVLHDDWREITDDEVADARHYTQRILEDFYDDRPTVETLLIQKKKLAAPQQPPTVP
jgi:hypothetical protein